MTKIPFFVTILLAVPAFAQTDPQKMSFFITSEGPGNGAALGGLAGADQHCQKLAKAAGSTKTWRAYLSTSAADGKPAVNAKDRIGNGPWVNAKGVTVASSVADLHSANNKLGKENSITEKGEVVNGRGDTPNQHDILTGSQLDGTVTPGDADTTCKNWTSSDASGSANVGHHDRQGGGTNPTSWNFAHGSKGCGQANLVATGGAGKYYCFAIN
jgi:collagenase NC10/endostatin